MDPIASLVLGKIERLVGGGERKRNRHLRLQISRYGCDTTGYGDLFASSGRMWNASPRFAADSVRHGARCLLSAGVEQQNELITADPPDQIPAAPALRQYGREGLQYPVAGAMS